MILHITFFEMSEIMFATNSQTMISCKIAIFTLDSCICVYNTIDDC